MMTHQRPGPLLDRGTVLNGRWEILAHIATGGKGEVYRARQVNLQREVAVKIVSPAFIESMAEDKEELDVEMARFKREVLAMARARHPYVLQVYDYDNAEVAGHRFDYIVMEYVLGSTLRLTMPVEGFGFQAREVEEWINRYFLLVLEGMETVHALGILHRDLKPENVLLDDQTPKITDFGLAGGKIWDSLTRSHHALGTIAYMAPEQFSDMDIADVRADVYSLGKILYEAITGKLTKNNALPFQTASLPNPIQPFFQELDQIIRKATAKAPGDRFPSVKELHFALARLVASTQPSLPDRDRKNEPEQIVTKIKPRTKMTAALVLILTIVAIVYLIFFNGPDRTTSIPSTFPVSSTALDDSPRKTVDQARIQRKAGAPYVTDDNTPMRFVPGGQFSLITAPNDYAGRTVSVGSFLMDENEVTNQQYVEFLNEQLTRIRVKDKLVEFDGNIWLYLGEISEGYEPIFYLNGRFVVNGPQHAACPVVRVTAYGAAAYSYHYGRRLPTVDEWLHAAKSRHLETSEIKTNSGMTGAPPTDRLTGDSYTGMHESKTWPKEFDTLPSPVGQSPANEYLIVGLDANVSEWAVSAGQERQATRYFIMGGLGVKRAEPSSRAIERSPWEAFGTVGFRTVLTVN